VTYIAAYGGVMSSPTRRPLSIAAPSAPPPVFAIASGYEPRSIPAEAYSRERRRRRLIIPATIAIALLLICGGLALLLYRLRSLR
jgi:hypothetical protein